MPPIRKTSFQKFNVDIEFDPDIDWEEVPEEDVDEEDCCKCTGGSSICEGETGTTAFIATAAAQTVAYHFAE